MANDDKQHLKEQPIIIKKVKKGGGHGHHGGAWKVAYADFVTAMMAFFIVMWILASSEEVKQNVSDYFNNPTEYSIFTGERKTGTVPVDLNLFDAQSGRKEDAKSDNLIKFDKETADTLINRFLQKAARDSTVAAQRVESVSNELSQMLKSLETERPELKPILESIKIEMTKDGLLIELIETSENLFFQIGSAQLSPHAIDILKVLGKEVGKLPNYIEIQGHTDSRGYKSNDGYTNWDLSADRANSARRVLQSYGLWDGQLTRVTGFADQNLRNPDNPFDKTNRRISILVRHLNANQFLSQDLGVQSDE